MSLMKGKLIQTAVATCLAAFSASADVISGPQIPSEPATLLYVGAISAVVALCAWFALTKIKQH